MMGALLEREANTFSRVSRKFFPPSSIAPTYHELVHISRNEVLQIRCDKVPIRIQRRGIKLCLAAARILADAVEHDHTQ